MTESSDYNNYNVLFVENSKKSLESLEILTFDEPYVKMFTISIKEALSIVKMKKIAVVVCEMRFQDITGLEVLQKIAEISVDTIGIIVTSYSQKTTLLTALNSGLVYRFIPKPYEGKEELIPWIRSAVNEFRLREENRLKINDYNENLNHFKKKINSEYLEHNRNQAFNIRTNLLVDLVEDFTHSVSHSLQEMTRFIDSHNSRLHTLLMPYISKLNYEFDNIKVFAEIIRDSHDLENKELDLNDLIKKIIAESEHHFKKFKIFLNYKEKSKIIFKGKKEVVSFILKDLIGRAIKLNIVRSLDILLSENSFNYLVVLSFELNLKVDKIYSSLENLMGLHYKEYFEKITGIVYRTKNKENLYSIIMEIDKDEK